jgi:hypothetical protein
MRGRDQSSPGAIRLNQVNPAENGAHRQTAVIRRLMGRPAVIAAVVVGPSDSIPASIDVVAPILVSVRFIDDGVLSRIAGQLRLNNLRKLDHDPVRPQPRLHLRRGNGCRSLESQIAPNSICARRSRTAACSLYQPVVNKSGEKVVGVEALCRWTHPTRGEISA